MNSKEYFKEEFVKNKSSHKEVNNLDLTETFFSEFNPLKSISFGENPKLYLDTANKILLGIDKEKYKTIDDKLKWEELPKIKSKFKEVLPLLFDFFKNGTDDLKKLKEEEVFEYLENIMFFFNQINPPSLLKLIRTESMFYFEDGDTYNDGVISEKLKYAFYTLLDYSLNPSNEIVSSKIKNNLINGGYKGVNKKDSSFPFSNNNNKYEIFDFNIFSFFAISNFFHEACGYRCLNINPVKKISKQFFNAFLSQFDGIEAEFSREEKIELLDVFLRTSDLIPKKKDVNLTEHPFFVYEKIMFSLDYLSEHHSSFSSQVRKENFIRSCVYKVIDRIRHPLIKRRENTSFDDYNDEFEDDELVFLARKDAVNKDYLSIFQDAHWLMDENFKKELMDVKKDSVKKIQKDDFIYLSEKKFDVFFNEWIEEMEVKNIDFLNGLLSSKEFNFFNDFKKTNVSKNSDLENFYFKIKEKRSKDMFCLLFSASHCESAFSKTVINFGKVHNVVKDNKSFSNLQDAFNFLNKYHPEWLKNNLEKFFFLKEKMGAFEFMDEQKEIFGGALELAKNHFDSLRIKHLASSNNSIIQESEVDKKDKIKIGRF